MYDTVSLHPQVQQYNNITTTTTNTFILEPPKLDIYCDINETPLSDRKKTIKNEKGTAYITLLTQL